MVTVQLTGHITSVNHVIFMMQENRSFDTYFGMLNPYRHANGFDVGDDGKTYAHGIDHKLTTIQTKMTKGTSFTSSTPRVRASTT